MFGSLKSYGWCADISDRTSEFFEAVNLMAQKFPHHPLQLFSKLALLVAVVVASLTPASPTDADEIDDEQAFVELINELRTSQGLRPLEVHPELIGPSRDWAEHLAEVEDLVHADDLTVGVSVYWVKMGENIGTASSGQTHQLFSAFVESPTHLENLLDPTFEYVGVGVFYGDDGRMWTTHRFMSVDESLNTGPLPFSDGPSMDPAAVSHLVLDLSGSGV